MWWWVLVAGENVAKGGGARPVVAASERSDRNRGVNTNAAKPTAVWEGGGGWLVLVE